MNEHHNILLYIMRYIYIMRIHMKIKQLSFNTPGGLIHLTAYFLHTNAQLTVCKRSRSAAHHGRRTAADHLRWSAEDTENIWCSASSSPMRVYGSTNHKNMPYFSNPKPSSTTNHSNGHVGFSMNLLKRTVYKHISSSDPLGHAEFCEPSGSNFHPTRLSAILNYVANIAFWSCTTALIRSSTNLCHGQMLLEALWYKKPLGGDASTNMTSRSKKHLL